MAITVGIKDLLMLLTFYSSVRFNFTIYHTQILKIFSVDKKVCAIREDKQAFWLSETLKELTVKLPNNFLRISHSEIVNADKIVSFELTFGGKLKIYLRSGEVTYSSRGYLQNIKEYFGI